MKPLSDKLRWLLLIVLGIVFVTGTPVLIGYSKGYRLGDALNLIATGGIFIHSDIANTDVYVNNEYVKRSGTLLRNTLIQNLSPNDLYQVRVEKEGYQTWNKRLTIEPNLVTEVRVLMLPVPSAFVWTPIVATTTTSLSSSRKATSTLEVATSSEHLRLAERFENSLDQFEYEVASTSFVTVRGVRIATTTLVRETRYPEWLERIASTTGFEGKEQVREREGIVVWLDGGDIHGTWVHEQDETPPFFMCTTVCVKTLVLDWSEPFLQFEFFPNKSDVVVVGTEKGIFAVELDTRSERNVHTILEGKNLRFLLDGDTLTVFDGMTFRETIL